MPSRTLFHSASDQTDRAAGFLGHASNWHISSVCLVPLKVMGIVCSPYSTFVTRYYKLVTRFSRLKINKKCQ